MTRCLITDHMVSGSRRTFTQIEEDRQLYEYESRGAVLNQDTD